METKKVVVGGGGTHSFAVRLYLHYFQIMFKSYLSKNLILVQWPWRNRSLLAFFSLELVLCLVTS